MEKSVIKLLDRISSGYALQKSFTALRLKKSKMQETLLLVCKTWISLEGKAIVQCYYRSARMRWPKKSFQTDFWCFCDSITF